MNQEKAFNTRPVVVLAADEKYIAQLATTLRSLVEASRRVRSFEIKVLTSGVTECAKARVAASLPPNVADIEWIPIDLQLFRGFATLEYVSAMTFARLLIPRVLPKSVTKVIYLDTDVLVLDDVWELWQIDLNGAVVGAVVDELDAQINDGMPGLEHVPRVKSYFNAGVLMIDLDLWRREKVSELAFDYLSKNSQIYMDQDALNDVCDGRWHPLPPHWNYQDHYTTDFSKLPVEQLPGIVHFVTKIKPWVPRALSMNAAFYDSFRNRTAFALTPTERTSRCIMTEWFRLRRFLGQSSTLRACRDRLFRRDKVVVANGEM